MSELFFPYEIADFKILHPLANERKRKINSVYLVEHKENGIKGVLKHLSKTAGNKHLTQFLRNEASFHFEMEQLPVTYAFMETDEEILLIKSYSEGVSLSEYWDNIPKKLRVEFIGLLITKLIPIGSELKRLGIVHADFKPSNLILDGSDLEFEVSLIDFGLAFYPEKNPNRRVIFSLGYSPPELILNQLQLANHSSDLYSFGICLYQLLSGKLPLMHPNPAIMTNLQVTHPLPHPNAISKSMFRVLQKCCAKKAFPKPPNMLSQDEINSLLLDGIKMRYQSFGEMYKDYDLFMQKPGFWKRLIKIFSKS